MERNGDFISKQLVKNIFQHLAFASTHHQILQFWYTVENVLWINLNIIGLSNPVPIDMIIIVPNLAKNWEFRVSILNHISPSLDKFFVVHSITLFPWIFHYHGDKKYPSLGGIRLLVLVYLVGKIPLLYIFSSFNLLIAV